MTVDGAVVPGLLLLAAEFIALAAVGYVVARVALRQRDERMALAQGLVIGPALWGLIANVAMYPLPGLAGLLVAWGITLTLGAGLVWRAPQPIRPQVSTTAGFVVAVLGIFWVALACRQMLSLADWQLHLGLAASIQAGGFPPALPWQPGMLAPYHYGFDMLVGLLAPPVGPDLAFVTELLGAYVWMSFALTVVTLLLHRGSWVVMLALAPLLLTTGSSTLGDVGSASDILRIPFPTGGPPAPIPASLGELYWPPSQFPWPNRHEVPPGNISWPSFPLAYALAFIVLERAADSSRRWSWRSALTLAALLGFLGLVSEAAALVVLVLWAILEAVPVLRGWRRRTDRAQGLLRAATGPVLAALLLASSGGVVTGALTGASSGGLSLEWPDNLARGQPLGAFRERLGAIGLLGLGPLAVAAIAAVVAWRDRFTLALVAASGTFVLAALTLHYEPSPVDITRLSGHARNFALLGLLAALNSRIPTLRSGWRYAAGALVFALVTWPTAIAPAHSVGIAMSRGPHFANAQLGPQEFGEWFLGRYALGRFTTERFMAEPVADYVRAHAAATARILSPSPGNLTVATGRPNASGFTSFSHLLPFTGPAYTDAIGLLDPAAIRHLGFDYVHATDEWVASLPPRALRRLENPAFFELLIRDGPDALYRVRPAFAQLDADPESSEALRRAVASSATVYLSPTMDPENAARAASTLSHAQLYGEVSWSSLHALKIPVRTAPLGGRTPDLVVASARLAPSTFPVPAQRLPVWGNDEIAVYAPGGAIGPVAPARAPTFSVRLSGVRVDDGRITFTATFADRAPARWSSQDWQVIPMDSTAPWAFPQLFRHDGRRHEAAQWYAGQVLAGFGLVNYNYEFDARASRLSTQGADGRFTAAQASERRLAPGRWTLAVRLRYLSSRGHWEDVALIPAVHILVADSGEVSYAVYEGALSVGLAR